MTPFDAVFIWWFGPLGIGIAAMLWLGYTAWKILEKLDVEVNRNSGTSVKDMLHDQREYTKDSLELLRSMSANQREVKELLRTEHKAADKYRVWASQKIEDQAAAFDKLDGS